MLLLQQKLLVYSLIIFKFKFFSYCIIYKIDLSLPTYFNVNLYIFSFNNLKASMSSTVKNKENLSEHKKSSKDAKLLKSKLLLKEGFPFKNQGLQHINRSLDMSEVTIDSSRKRK
jgi:hypothetical protein